MTRFAPIFACLITALSAQAVSAQVTEVTADSSISVPGVQNIALLPK
jgi:hypothetical protein